VLEKDNFWKPLAIILVAAPSRLSLRRLRLDLAMGAMGV
jgi:hypothetical protein